MTELYNQATEASLIAILLQSDVDTIIEVINRLEPGDFGSKQEGIPVLGSIFKLIGNIITDSKYDHKLTHGILSSEITKYPKICQALGGENNLTKSILAMQKVELAEGDIDYYIDEIKKYSAARQLIAQSEVLKQKLSSQIGSMSLHDVLAEVEQIKFEHNKNSQLDGGHIAEGIDQFMDVKAGDINTILGVPSRFKTLNQIHYGYQSQTLTVWSSFTNGGKSIVLLNEADYIANDLRIPVLYIDTEMVTKQVVPRLISMRCGHESCGDPNLMLSPRDIKLGIFQNDKTKVSYVKKQVEAIKNGKLYFCSIDSFDEESLSRIVRYYIMKYGIELIVFDYFKMPRVAAKSGLNETQMLGNLVETVKNGIAKKYDKPIISACQTDQKERDRIADSARIMRFSDMVINWHRKEDIKTDGHGTHEGFIQKNREDVRDVGINFNFIGSTAGIEEGDNRHIRLV